MSVYKGARVTYFFSIINHFDTILRQFYINIHQSSFERFVPIFFSTHIVHKISSNTYPSGLNNNDDNNKSFLFITHLRSIFLFYFFYRGGGGTLLLYYLFYSGA